MSPELQKILLDKLPFLLNLGLVVLFVWLLQLAMGKTVREAFKNLLEGLVEEFKSDMGKANLIGCLVLVLYLILIPPFSLFGRVVDIGSSGSHIQDRTQTNFVILVLFAFGCMIMVFVTSLRRRGD